MPQACANENAIANQRMSTRRSQRNGDRMHPARGTDRRRLNLGHHLLGLPNQNKRNGRTAKPGAGQLAPLLGIRKKSKKSPLAIMVALNAHQKMVRKMGPECRCAVRNAAATRVGGVRAGCGV